MFYLPIVVFFYIYKLYTLSIKENVLLSAQVIISLINQCYYNDIKK